MTDDPLQGSVEGRLVRGGTSKGWFVRRDALPDVSDDRMDALAMELFGTPDPLQVDGIGGSKSHTSKLMVVEPSERDGVDVDYTFGQVGVDRPVVDWSGNCGNLTSAIGVFGLIEGLVDADGDVANLTLYNTNTETVVEQQIPLRDGAPDVYGDYTIDGVPGTGARVDSSFLDPAGGVYGSLLPTGNERDTVTVDGEAVEFSLVDVTNPCVFVHAATLDLDGIELPDDLSPDVIARAERIRGAVCERIGVVDDSTKAADESPTTPFLAFVSEPQSYDCSVEKYVEADEIDITARVFTTGTPHHAYAMTGAMCLAATTKIQGTIPNEVVRPNTGRSVTIGHPKGAISVAATVSGDADPHVEQVTVGRTARQLVRGEAFYRYVDGLGALRD